MSGFERSPGRADFAKLFRQFDNIGIFGLLQVHHGIDRAEGKSGVCGILQITIRPGFRQPLATAKLLQRRLAADHQTGGRTGGLLFELLNFFDTVSGLTLSGRLLQKATAFCSQCGHGIHHAGKYPRAIVQITPGILQATGNGAVQHVHLLILQQLIAERFGKGLQLIQAVLGFQSLLQLIAAGDAPVNQASGMTDERFGKSRALFLKQLFEGFEMGDEQGFLANKSAPGLGGAAHDKFLVLKHQFQIARCGIKQIP